MRVAAVRNSVYVGEQECPYDVRSMTATTWPPPILLTYIGDEPAGYMRPRFFADFAKFERVAIRKEFRKSRAAYQAGPGRPEAVPEKRLSPRLSAMPKTQADEFLTPLRLSQPIAGTN